jgi:transposase
LPGLLPQRRGPRRAHKLSAEVVAALEEARSRDPSLTTPQLVALVRERFGLSVHRRSIERALARPKTPWRP